MSRIVVAVAFALVAIGAGCTAGGSKPGGVIVLPDAKIGDSVGREDVARPDAASDAADAADAAKDVAADPGPDGQPDVAAETVSDGSTDGAADSDADTEPDAALIPPPTTGPELRKWLEAGSYRGWVHETTPHLSVGGHDGNVRAYLDPILVKSLTAGATSYPSGAAAVMELYKTTSDQTFGWVAWVKTDAQSDGGKNIFWYWLLDGVAQVSGNGAANCTACHSAGVDFLHTSFPLK